MTGHPWFQCRPAILGLDGRESASPLGVSQLEIAWSRLTDVEQHLFHNFTCEGDQSPAAVRVMEQLAEAIRSGDGGGSPRRPGDPRGRE